MPIALDSEKTFDVVLLSDMKKKDGSRPTFRFHHLTSRQWIELSDCVDEIIKIGESGRGEHQKQLTSIIASHLRGWKNMGCEFIVDDNRLEWMLDSLTREETYELAGRLLVKSDMSGDDLKKSDAPLQSDSRSSAQDAE
jgi:hypothetical protein